MSQQVGALKFSKYEQLLLRNQHKSHQKNNNTTVNNNNNNNTINSENPLLPATDASVNFVNETFPLTFSYFYFGSSCFVGNLLVNSIKLLVVRNKKYAKCWKQPLSLHLDHNGMEQLCWFKKKEDHLQNDKMITKVQVRDLYLDYNSLSKIEKLFFQQAPCFKNLYCLSLTHNNLNELPAAFFESCGFENLKILRLSHNKLSSLGSIFTSGPQNSNPRIFQTLETLSLLSNNFESYESLKEVLLFKELINLDFRNNPLSKEDEKEMIKDSILNCKHLCFINGKILEVSATITPQNNTQDLTNKPKNEVTKETKSSDSQKTSPQLPKEGVELVSTSTTASSSQNSSTRSSPASNDNNNNNISTKPKPKTNDFVAEKVEKEVSQQKKRYMRMTDGTFQEIGINDTTTSRSTIPNESVNPIQTNQRINPQQEKAQKFIPQQDQEKEKEKEKKRVGPPPPPPQQQQPEILKVKKSNPIIQQNMKGMTDKGKMIDPIPPPPQPAAKYDVESEDEYHNQQQSQEIDQFEEHANVEDRHNNHDDEEDEDEELGHSEGEIFYNFYQNKRNILQQKPENGNILIQQHNQNEDEEEDSFQQQQQDHLYQQEEEEEEVEDEEINEREGRNVAEEEEHEMSGEEEIYTDEEEDAQEEKKFQQLKSKLNLEYEKSEFLKEKINQKQIDNNNNDNVIPSLKNSQLYQQQQQQQDDEEEEEQEEEEVEEERLMAPHTFQIDEELGVDEEMSTSNPLLAPSSFSNPFLNLSNSFSNKKKLSPSKVMPTTNPIPNQQKQIPEKKEMKQIIDQTYKEKEKENLGLPQQQQQQDEDEGMEFMGEYQRMFFKRKQILNHNNNEGMNPHNNSNEEGIESTTQQLRSSRLQNFKKSRDYSKNRQQIPNNGMIPIQPNYPPPPQQQQQQNSNPNQLLNQQQQQQNSNSNQFLNQQNNNNMKLNPNSNQLMNLNQKPNNSNILNGPQQSNIPNIQNVGIGKNNNNPNPQIPPPIKQQQPINNNNKNKVGVILENVVPPKPQIGIGVRKMEEESKNEVDVDIEDEIDEVDVIFEMKKKIFMNHNVSPPPQPNEGLGMNDLNDNDYDGDGLMQQKRNGIQETNAYIEAINKLKQIEKLKEMQKLKEIEKQKLKEIEKLKEKEIQQQKEIEKQKEKEKQKEIQFFIQKEKENQFFIQKEKENQFFIQKLKETESKNEQKLKEAESKLKEVESKNEQKLKESELKLKESESKNEKKEEKLENEIPLHYKRLFQQQQQNNVLLSNNNNNNDDEKKSKNQGNVSNLNLKGNATKTGLWFDPKNIINIMQQHEMEENIENEKQEKEKKDLIDKSLDMLENFLKKEESPQQLDLNAPTIPKPQQQGIMNQGSKMLGGASNGLNMNINKQEKPNIGHGNVLIGGGVLRAVMGTTITNTGIDDMFTSSKLSEKLEKDLINLKKSNVSPNKSEKQQQQQKASSSSTSNNNPNLNVIQPKPQQQSQSQSQSNDSTMGNDDPKQNRLDSLRNKMKERMKSKLTSVMLEGNY